MRWINVTREVDMRLLKTVGTLLMVLPWVIPAIGVAADAQSAIEKPGLSSGRPVPITPSVVQDEVKLAMEIVHKYRTLREECSSLPENLRPMCLYRLNIGNWDYKEAKSILARHNLL